MKEFYSCYSEIDFEFEMRIGEIIDYTMN
jgi:hypothetical protein